MDNHADRKENVRTIRVYSLITAVIICWAVGQGCGGKINHNGYHYRETKSDNKVIFRKILQANSDDSGISCSDANSCHQSTDRGDSFFNMTGDEFRARNCFCDKQCVIYGDCCSDAVKDTMTSPSATDEISCEIASAIDTAEEVYIVRTCPRNYKDQFIKANCLRYGSQMQEEIHRWPVSRLSDGLLYANTYCARCNGQMNVSYWNATVRCNKNPQSPVNASANVTQMVNSVSSDGHLSKKCTLWYQHAKFKPRYCKPAIANCSHSNSRYKTLCQSQPAAYVYTHDATMVFRNKYCALCNDVSEANMTCVDPNTLYNQIFSQFNPNRREITPTTYRCMFDINPLKDRDQGTGVCSDGLSGQTIRKEIVVTLEQCAHDEVYDPFARLCRQLTCRAGQVFDEQQQDCRFIDQNENDTFHNETGLYPLHNSTQVGDRQCAMVTLNASEFTVLDNGSLFYDRRQLYDVGSYQLLGFNGSDGAKVCKRSDWQQGYNVYSILIMFQFDAIQHVVNSTGIIISLTAMTVFIFIYVWKATLRNLPGKIMLCLVMALFIGQLLFLTSLYRTEHRYVCLVCAVTMHFVFLASFFWMNVMAFDLCRTFASDSYYSSDSNKRFIRYSLYAWLVPALIVTSSVVIDVLFDNDIDLFGVGGDMRPRYATKHICWITSRQGLFLWYAAPISIIMVANLILYIITVRSIYIVSKVAMASLTELPSKGHVLLFIKLSLVMGLTWLFGFLAAIFDVVALWYVFIVFNTLQGALVAVLFLCTKRVYRILRTSVKGKQPHTNPYANTSDAAATRKTFIPASSNKTNTVQETRI